MNEYTDKSVGEIAEAWILGNREDALASIEALAPAGIALFFYDAAENGLSRDDLLRIVNRLQDRLYEKRRSS